MSPVGRRLRILVLGLLLLHAIVLLRVFVMQVVSGASWSDPAEQWRGLAT